MWPQFLEERHIKKNIMNEPNDRGNRCIRQDYEDNVGWIAQFSEEFLLKK